MEFELFFNPLKNMKLKPKLEVKLIEEITQFIGDHADEIDPDELVYFINSNAYTDKLMGDNLIGKLKDKLISEGRCSNCLKMLESEDYIREKEISEFWGAPATEEIEIGYRCSNCRHKEEF